MCKLLFVVLICASACLGAKYIKNAPDWIKPCNAGEENYKRCSTESIRILYQHLYDGLPEYGISPIDPLSIDRIHIKTGGGPINIDIHMKDVTVQGLKNMEVISNDVDLIKNQFNTYVKVPKLRIDGKYRSKGRILIVPLNGQGDCWIEPSDVNVDIVTKFNIFNLDNHKFFNITSVHAQYTVGGMQLYLGNLFDKQKELSEGTNDYLNKNWKETSEALKPTIKTTIEEIFESVMHRIFLKIPADFLIPNILEIN